ncbi:MAG: hypothetical protein NVSMB51_05440 [Solirubrobacteraceae bacterium]
MKRFACASVVPDCDAVFQGADESEILSQVSTHACAAHGMDEVPPALLEQVRSRIEEIPAA